MAAVSIRHALELADSSVTVLDLDGTYRPVAGEQVLVPADIGVTPSALHHQAMILGVHGLSRWLYPSLLTGQREDGPVTAIAPGVIILRPPAELEGACAEGGLGVISRLTSIRADDHWPRAEDALQVGGYSASMVAVQPDRTEVLGWWRDLALLPGSADRWLDWLTSRSPHGTVRSPSALLSPWTLTPEQRIDVAPQGSALLLDGVQVTAVDLSRLDPSQPWLLDSQMPESPRARLSDHPALYGFVARVTDELAMLRAVERPGTWDPTVTALGVRANSALRALHRAACAEAAMSGGELPPDPYDPAQAGQYRQWLTEAPDGEPGRYLRAILRTRSDLQGRYPLVPGEDSPAYLEWAATHGIKESQDARGLVEEGVANALGSRGPDPGGRLKRGVNVVGFLTGELGIGESARLMLGALNEAKVPNAAVTVAQNLMSRTSAPAPSPSRSRFETTLLCVNADLTGRVAMAVPGLMRRTYRIGMWYWEVDHFPETQHDGFNHVDEVWVATDFVRRAIETHSPVPVFTVMPPLPQRGPEPTITQSQLGIPERDYFLFSFDFLSTAERKNPSELIDAFAAAFRPGEGPLLVIKSINAHQRPSEAERLRLRAAGEPDVQLIEERLGAAERDALVARCACYVSLHRSEGLGLTIAEAMAWGRPVIATGYSGNLAFMTDENSFLVPWTPTAIPNDAAPYPPGGSWAQPDLDAAARLMRTVVDDTELAARRGARAARDIATLHSPEAAGRRIAHHLGRPGLWNRTLTPHRRQIRRVVSLVLSR
jgi:glycosyltransferase involved in cell wall biosynthesis